jgi:hypothetical protein
MTKYAFYSRQCDGVHVYQGVLMRQIFYIKHISLGNLTTFDFIVENALAVFNAE